MLIVWWFFKFLCDKTNNWLKDAKWNKIDIAAEI